ncbi:MAG: hypothetical protein JJE52_01570 [Acidimicrobiia bacterium]|nr:hypothetical protein [Acidimicrobiia bacterium]
MGLIDEIPRWQYRIVNSGTFSTAERLGMALSYFGQQAWEHVTVYDKASNWVQGFEKGFILFKRAVPPGEQPEGGWSEVWTADHVIAAYNALTAP